MVRIVVPVPLRRRRALFAVATSAALAVGAIAACGDVTAPRASLPTLTDTASAYLLNGAPPGAPTAFQLFSGTMVTADANFQFDIAFDIDADGRIRVLPVRTIANGLASAHSVGLQAVSTPFDALTVAPSSGYKRDSVLVVATGTTVAIEATDPVACATSFIASNVYAKIVVDAYDPAARRVHTRYTVDPNCGFRSFESGVPSWVK
jgi:hypothetical protein